MRNCGAGPCCVGAAAHYYSSAALSQQADAQAPGQGLRHLVLISFAI